MPDPSALDMVNSRAAGQPALSISGRSGDLPTVSDPPEPEPEPKAAPAVEKPGRPDDFDSVVFNPALPVTQDMAVAIANEPDPDGIAYYLGKNPAEAARIAGLSPIAQVSAIGRVAERVAVAAALAPKSKPAATLRGREPSAPSRPLEDLSVEEYAIRRNAERQVRAAGPESEMEKYAQKRGAELAKAWQTPIFGRVR